MDDPSSGDRKRSAAIEPRYVHGQKPLTAYAHFPSGKVLEVSRGRTRAYPGLPGEAPRTNAFYTAVGVACPGASVLDVGCGSGVGTHRLSEDFSEVIGIDVSSDALEFAREYFPGARYVASDLSEPAPDATASSAAVIDVLGHAKDPVGLLKSLRVMLEPGAKLFAAEPRAYASQRLAAPARRAFSPARLSALLVQGGFEVTTFVAEESSFVACVAERIDDEAWTAFDAARSLRSESNAHALRALDGAPIARSGRLSREMALLEAEIRTASSDFDGAVRALLNAADIDRSDPRPPTRLCELLLASGSPADALPLALQAVECDPSDPDAARALARCADASGSRDALGAWRIAARLEPDRLDVCARLAELSSAAGDFRPGIVAFENLRHYGDELSLDFYMTLALMMNAEGRHADALLEARFAKALAPHDPAVLELCQELGAR